MGSLISFWCIWYFMISFIQHKNVFYEIVFAPLKHSRSSGLSFSFLKVLWWQPLYFASSMNREIADKVLAQCSSWINTINCNSKVRADVKLCSQCLSRNSLKPVEFKRKSAKRVISQADTSCPAHILTSDVRAADWALTLAECGDGCKKKKKKDKDKKKTT